MREAGGNRSMGTTNRSPGGACRQWPSSHVSPQQERWCLSKSKLAANPEAIKASGHKGYGWRALSGPAELFLLGLPSWDKLEQLFQGRKYASQQGSPSESKSLWQGSLCPVLKRNGLVWNSGGVVGLWPVGATSFQRTGLSEGSIEKPDDHTHWGIEDSVSNGQACLP